MAPNKERHQGNTLRAAIAVTDWEKSENSESPERHDERSQNDTRPLAWLHATETQCSELCHGRGNGKHGA